MSSETNDTPRYRPLCESAKKGHLCMDDLCYGAGETLCGFDKSDDDFTTPDYYDFDDGECDDER